MVPHAYDGPTMPRKIFSERKLLKVYLEQDEWKWIELQAGDSISEWCREKLLEDYDNAGTDRELVRVSRPERKPKGKVREDTRGGETSGNGDRGEHTAERGPDSIAPISAGSGDDGERERGSRRKVKACVHGTEKGYRKSNEQRYRLPFALRTA
jgi:hypothetical protein